MRGWVLPACMAAALPWPAAATVVELAYHGTADYTPPQGSPTRYEELGTGRFDFDEAPGVATLAAGLRDFSFTTELAQTVSPVNGTAYVVPGRVTYGLADLKSFRASYSDGRLTGFAFETTSKAQPYGTASRVSFAAAPVGNGGPVLGRSMSPGQPGITGLVTAVPEPGSWALLVAGFGTLGYALRRGRAGRPATAIG